MFIEEQGASLPFYQLLDTGTSGTTKGPRRAWLQQRVRVSHLEHHAVWQDAADKFPHNSRSMKLSPLHTTGGRLEREAVSVCTHQ